MDDAVPSWLWSVGSTSSYVSSARLIELYAGGECTIIVSGDIVRTEHTCNPVALGLIRPAIELRYL